MFLRFILILILASPLSCSFELDTSIRGAKRQRTGKGQKHIEAVDNTEQATRDLVSGNNVVQGRRNPISKNNGEQDTRNPAFANTAENPYFFFDDGSGGENRFTQTKPRQAKPETQNAREAKEQIEAPGRVIRPQISFPIVATKNTRMVISINPDKTTLVANVVPANGGLNIISSFNGFFFREGSFVKLHSANRKFYYAIRVGDDASFSVRSGDVISKNQLLGQVKGPIGVSLFKSNKPIPACLKNVSKNKVEIKYIIKGKISKRCY